MDNYSHLNIDVAQDVDSAVLLLAAIEDISEELYFAGWHSGIEFKLWKIICFPSIRLSSSQHQVLEYSQIKLLQNLAKASGGWWSWTEGDRPCFITLDDWQNIYNSNSPLLEIKQFRQRLSIHESRKSSTINRSQTTRFE